MLGNDKIKLSGKCTIQIDTGFGASKMSIPKLSPAGENNADEFIKQAFHFAIKRHGTKKALDMLKEQVKPYETAPQKIEVGVTYESIEEWKQEIRTIFKQETGCSDHCCNVQADAFQEMHGDCALNELPSPMECYEAECDAANS